MAVLSWSQSGTRGMARSAHCQAAIRRPGHTACRHGSMASAPKPAPRRARNVAHDAVHVARDREREPRLPHDRDESADSQVLGPPDTQAIGRKAFDDIEAGRVDTDRGPVLEQLGRNLPSNEAPEPARKRRRR
jgi:hypothetical protein